MSSEANSNTIPAVDFHVADEEIDGAQAKMDRLTRELGDTCEKVEMSLNGRYTQIE